MAETLGINRLVQVSASDRRKQLIDASARVICRDGVAGATTREIAREAGVNKGILHYTFSQKEEIFLTLLRRASIDMEQMLDEEQVPDGVGLESAVRSLLLSYRKVERQMNFAQFEIWLWGMRTEAARAEVAIQSARELAIAREGLRRSASARQAGVDFDRMARHVIAFCSGLQFHYLCSGYDFFSDDEVIQSANQIVNLFCHEDHLEVA